MISVRDLNPKIPPASISLFLVFMSPLTACKDFDIRPETPNSPYQIVPGDGYLIASLLWPKIPKSLRSKPLSKSILGLRGALYLLKSVP
jgi:hypothetical protein